MPDFHDTNKAVNIVLGEWDMRTIHNSTLADDAVIKLKLDFMPCHLAVVTHWRMLGDLLDEMFGQSGEVVGQH